MKAIPITTTDVTPGFMALKSKEVVIVGEANTMPYMSRIALRLLADFRWKAHSLRKA